MTFIKLCFRPTTTVAAENLFLRKQLGLFIERKAKPRRATSCIRFTLAQLSCLFDWRNALTVVKPDTLIGWHRKGFRFFWKLKSRPRGRPPIPARLRNLIAEMASSNPTWGEERIADELFLKMGIRISGFLRKPFVVSECTFFKCLLLDGSLRSKRTACGSARTVR